MGALGSTRKPAKPRKARKGSPTYAALKRKADGVFSQYIRQRDEKDGCISCSAHPLASLLQAGHYISRVHLSTRWDERNVNAQCMACNVWRRGNAGEYTLGLIRKYGPNIIAELVEKKRQSVKLTRSDLQGIIEDCRAKIAGLS